MSRFDDDLTVATLRDAPDAMGSLSLGWGPDAVEPAGPDRAGGPVVGKAGAGRAEALRSSQMACGIGSHQMYGAGDRVDAEVGYGLPVGARFVGTPRVGLTTSPYGRDYRAGYGPRVFESGSLNLELGPGAQRRESATVGGASTGGLGQATLDW